MQVATVEFRDCARSSVVACQFHITKAASFATATAYYFSFAHRAIGGKQRAQFLVGNVWGQVTDEQPFRHRDFLTEVSAPVPKFVRLRKKWSRD